MVFPNDHNTPAAQTESLRLSGKRFIYPEVAIDGKRVEKPAKSQVTRVVAVTSQLRKCTADIEGALPHVC